MASLVLDLGTDHNCLGSVPDRRDAKLSNDCMVLYRQGAEGCCHEGMLPLCKDSQGLEMLTLL